MNKFRKIIQKTGFDFHRYYPEPEKLSYLKALDISTVLDIGANIGQFASEIRQVLPDAQIYSFEPLKECFDKLLSQGETLGNFRAFNFALGEKEGDVEMNKSSYTPSSSLLKMSGVHKTLFPHTRDHSLEQIEVKTLDNVAQTINLEREVLVKVDVQGFEDKVILGGKNVFSEARAIIMEVSFITLYEDQPTFDDLYQELKKLGFEYKGSLQQKINKQTGEIISEDSLFVRPVL